MNEQHGWALWFTGLPAAGKTTLAHAVREHLQRLGVASVVLDGDDLRALLTPKPTYSEAERAQFYRALVGIAALLTEQGCNVLIAATANQRAYREWGREQIPRFAEVWVVCPLPVCRARDPKGLYARVAAGEVATLPGVGDEYEPPQQPAIVVDTHARTVAQAATHVVTEMVQLHW